MRSITSRSITGLIITAVTLSACGKDGKDNTGDSSTPTTPSIIVSAELSRISEAVPLTRLLEVTLSEPARIEATVTDGTESKTWRFASVATEHSVPLIGFKPDHTWQVELSVVEEDGTVHTHPALDTEDSIVPTIWPDFDLNHIDPSRAQPGYTLLNLRSSGSPPVPDETWTLLDENYEPVWTLLHADQAKMVFQRADGLFMGLDKRADIQGQFASVKDLSGNVITEYHTDESWVGTGIPVVNTFAFHHDLIELPSGNFAALAKEPTGYPVDNFPISYDDSLIRQDGLNVNADRIIEFTPDGDKVTEIRLGDLMDTNRIGHDSLDASFLDGRLDWIHANGLDYDPGSDSFIVSFRHQDAVIKVDRQTGELKWILGTPTNWSPTHTPYLLTPDASVSWAYHQHSPSISDDGQRVIVFDNGNWRSSPWDGTVDPDDGPREMQSRIVEYQIDEAGMAVSQNWQFQPPDGQHGCPAVGGAKYLDNGNVLATFGLVVAINETLIQSQGLGDEAIRIIEFDPSDGNAIVGDVWISVPMGVLSEGWQAFFSTRVASPYPAGTLLDE